MTQARIQNGTTLGPPFDRDGLSNAAAAERLLIEGPNELPAAKPKSNLAIASCSEILKKRSR